ncbi:hypothetical protein N7537_007420 [Penicillium hordei]|uniref:Phospholipase D n=1 Tax=Penicillium hordei TaxID=40994 RepID=A0AAD6GZC6_9EURO|nr:uncharacterized protein N7537_007420 [Penicillium hordei]KAJ5597336.1 hypothetical protein N7537_007420 [Penicillium hordei]
MRAVQSVLSLLLPALLLSWIDLSVQYPIRTSKLDIAIHTQEGLLEEESSAQTLIGNEFSGSLELEGDGGSSFGSVEQGIEPNSTVDSTEKPSSKGVEDRLSGSTLDHGVKQHADIGDSEQNITAFNSQRPIWAIAHRVLTVKSVHDAILNGANALEIDMTAWRKGWYADHDGTLTSYGDTAWKMFQAIAEHRRRGATINFVWLDIKNPDWCPNNNKWHYCSTDNLRKMARDVIEPLGVRVLFGFYKPGPAYNALRVSNHHWEALNLNGKSKKVEDWFNRHGPMAKNKRVMSYGYFNLPFQFGNCWERDYYTCTELRQAVKSQGFGRVFGWTLATGQDKYADKLLSEGVDGLIYGFKATYYYDHVDTRRAANSIKRWVNNHAGSHRMANQNDDPW